MYWMIRLEDEISTQGRFLTWNIRTYKGASNGVRRKWDNENLHDASPNIIRMIKSKIGRECSMRDMRTAYRDLVRKPEWKTPLEDIRIYGRATESNKMDLEEIGWKNVN
jgi:hypothetical protein